MANATRAYSREMSPPPITLDYGVGNAGKVFDGQIMCFGTNGRLYDPDAANNLIFAGVTILDTEDDLAVGEKVRIGADMLIWLPFAAAQESDVGDLFYATDNATFTKTATNRKSIGMCRAWRKGEVLIDTSKAETE